MKSRFLFFPLSHDLTQLHSFSSHFHTNTTAVFKSPFFYHCMSSKLEIPLHGISCFTLNVYSSCMYEWEIMLKSEAEMTHAKINCFYINSTQTIKCAVLLHEVTFCFQQIMDFYPELIFMIYHFYSQYFIIICGFLWLLSKEELN